MLLETSSNHSHSSIMTKRRAHGSFYDKEKSAWKLLKPSAHMIDNFTEVFSFPERNRFARRTSTISSMALQLNMGIQHRFTSLSHSTKVKVVCKSVVVSQTASPIP